MKIIRRKKVLYITGLFTVITAWLITGISGPALPTFSLFNSAFLIIFGYTAMVYDINEKRVPNLLVMLMIAGWMLIIAIMMFFDITNAIHLLADSVFGLLTGGSLFLLIYLLSKKGLGGGDVKFMAAAGLYLGIAGTIPAILYGTVLAALTAAALILSKKIDRKDTIPLVPFLFIGIMITILT